MYFGVSMNALIDINYDSEDKCIYLYLLNRILKDTNFKPYFYVDATIKEINDFLNSDEDKKNLLNYIKDLETVKRIIINSNLNDLKNRIIERNFTKITVKYPKDVPKLRVLKELGEVYEHDIPFTKRYLIDNDIVPTTYYYDFEDETRTIANNNLPELKTISFDMEVYCEGREPDPEKNPILMTSFCSKDLKKVITYKPFEHEYVELVKDEKELIKRTIDILKDYDIIYTYNGDNFDFPYLKRRAEHFGIDVFFDRTADKETEIGTKTKTQKHKQKIKISRGGIHLRSYIPGKVHIDLYPIARRTLNLTKYKLEDVSYELFGVHKLEVGHQNISNLWNNMDKNLVEYSFQDAYYTYKIGEYFLPLEVMFSRIVNQTLFEVSRMGSSQMVEYLLLKHSFKNNFLAPNKPSNREYQKRLREYYEGGYVKEPIKGMHENIVSMDFRALYPSIIISYNISPDTIDCKCCEDTSEKILGHWFCKKRTGLIPMVLRNLIERRKIIKKILKEKSSGEEINNKDKENKNNENEYYKLLNYEQKSLKILANSHYGYMAYPRARWYSKECAEIITHLGRTYIQKTIEEAEKNGFKVIYSDTDGLYAVLNKNTDKKTLLNKTYEFLNKINEKLPKDMELEFEGYYKRGIFITKKRYALIDENDKITIKGLEFVRRDWSNIAKKTQKAVLETLLKEGDIEKAKTIIRNTITDLRNGKIDKKDLIIYTQLTKDINEYKTTAPHVEVAKKILKKGGRLNIGDVIGYIIVSGNKSISERATLPEDAKDYDTSYYIDNQILPPVLRIMESLGISKDELRNIDKQITLDGFFF